MSNERKTAIVSGKSVEFLVDAISDEAINALVALGEKSKALGIRALLAINKQNSGGLMVAKFDRPTFIPSPNSKVYGRAIVMKALFNPALVSTGLHRYLSDNAKGLSFVQSIKNAKQHQTAEWFHIAINVCRCAYVKDAVGVTLPEDDFLWLKKASFEWALQNNEAMITAYLDFFDQAFLKKNLTQGHHVWAEIKRAQTA